MNTKIFRDLSYGVYVVTSLDGDRPVGCIANSIMQVTSSPATIAVSLNHHNYTNGCVSATGKFAVSILAEQSDPSLIGGFGFRSSRDLDKFEGVPTGEAEGLPVLKGVKGYFVCRVIDRMETSTHTVFLGEVIAAEVEEEMKAPAMTYAYYHQVIKGKSPKNAPTYLPEEDGTAKEAAPAAAKTQWKCTVCGYIHEAETLDPDFTCPICGVGPDQFEKI